MNKPKHTVPNSDCIPGFWEVPKTEVHLKSGVVTKNIIMRNVKTLDNILDDESCDNLINLFDSSGIKAPVSVSGLMTNDHGIGSIRTTGWSEEIAEQLTKIIIPHLNVKTCNNYTPTDWWQHKTNPGWNSEAKRVWKPHSISPMLRFMRYGKGSEHYAHYDAGYIYDERFRTLKSMVIYLTTNKVGATRFIEDEQHVTPINRRNHKDWERRVQQHEVIYSSFPKKGKVLLFDHRLCHDVESYDGAEETGRIIIRGDVIYEAMEN